MNLKAIGWARVIAGLRQGNQSALLAGLGLVLLQHLRNSRSHKELVYRKRLPVGSSIVVRHTRRGEPKLEILPPRS